VSAFLESVLELHALSREGPCAEHPRETIQLRCAGPAATDAPRDAAAGDDVVTVSQLLRPWIDADAPLDERRGVSKRLRALRPAGVLVLNGDDPFAAPLAGSRLDAQLVRFGMTPGLDVSASIAHIEPSRMLLDARIGGEQSRIDLSAAGATIASWALAAAATALALGISANTIIPGLERASVPAGGLEQVRAGWPREVDRFQTCLESAQALAESLFLLRERGYARIHTVVSVDATSPWDGLARVLETGAHTCVLTASHSTSRSRLETIGTLRDELSRPGRAFVELEPRRALSRAERLARPGDVILQIRSPREGHADRWSRAVTETRSAPRRAS
jgi:hypothetical protein